MSRPIVVSTFPGYTQHFESLEPFLYPDLKGIITFDAGLVCSRGMALSMPWIYPDGRPATHDEIEAMYDVVSSPAALATDQQGGAHYAAMTSIRCTPEGLASAFAGTLARFEKQLRTFLHAWDDAKANAQLAAFSHAWAFGGLFPATWPAWTSCFNAGDFAGCAAQDLPSAHEWALQNVSFKARIGAEQALLRAAADADPDQIVGFP